MSAALHIQTRLAAHLVAANTVKEEKEMANYQNLSDGNSRSIQDVIDMLDKQIEDKRFALLIGERDITTLQAIREQTAQMLSSHDEKTSMERVEERVESRKKQAVLDELDTLIEEQEKQSGGRFAGENAGLEIPADGEYITFTDKQENWQRVYWAMKRGRISLSGMSRELDWGTQKVRDCLRGLRRLGLVYKDGQDTYRLVENDDTLITNLEDAKHSFTSRQWRWELVFKLILAGYTTSSSISNKLSMHGMDRQRVSDILGKLRNLGLVSKKTKNKWVATGKGHLFCDYQR